MFDGARSNVPRGRLCNLDELREMLTKWQPGGSKAALPAWSPARYEPGQTRGKANVAEVTCLVFDLDDGMPVEAAVELFSEAGCTFILHTSWSHTPRLHKFRLVFPLMMPVPGLQWPRAWRAALGWWREVCGDEWTPDTACCDSSRLFFLPAYRPEQSSRRTFAGRGHLLDLDWESVPVEAPRPVVPAGPAHRIVSGARAEKAVRNRLRNDPAARKALGRALGGSVGDELVRHVPCPQCGRRDVWWPVHPDKKKTAECNHRNSCGYHGQLDALAYALGVAA